MKKKIMLLFVLVFVVSVVTACDDSYSVENNEVILNTKNLEVTDKLVGKQTDYYLSYEDSKGKKKKKELSSNIATKIEEELKIVKKANKILESEKVVEYDLFIDSEVIEGVSLSKNRK